MRWALRMRLFLFLLLPSALSIPASPHAFRETQPDGTTTPQLRMNGDESYSFVTDAKGYTVIRDNGWDVYAIKDKSTGYLKSSGLQLGKVDPRKHEHLVKGVLPDLDVIRASRNRHFEPENSCNDHQCNRVLTSRSKHASGKLKNLVLLMRFRDHKKRELPSKQDFVTLMNNPGGHSTLAPTGSVRDVYRESSFGKLEVESVVYDWVDLSKDEAYYADNNSGLTPKFFEAIHEALGQLDSDRRFKFRDFDKDRNGEIDAITLVHSGYGAEWGGLDCDSGQPKEDRIWSHQRATMRTKWCGKESVCVNRYMVSPGLWGTCGSNISRIGVFAHELGHFLGLQDMYDGSGGKGIGSYGLMGNCWGFDGSQYYPPLLDPWSRTKLGWVTPTTLKKSGRYSLESSSRTGQVYRVDDGFPSKEYLLIENRQPIGFDAKMPQGGLVIFHIDEKANDRSEGYPGQHQWPQNGNHYRIALLQADGAYHLEKGIGQGDRMDVWHGDGTSYIGPSENQDGPWPNTDSYQDGNIEQTGIVIRDISTSSDKMSFSLILENSRTEPPTFPPTSRPTLGPTKNPTQTPTPVPTLFPTPLPTYVPTTQSPTPVPTLIPTPLPTYVPTPLPPLPPTKNPSQTPTPVPTSVPTLLPTHAPTPLPSLPPTKEPTSLPSGAPTTIPSFDPTTSPTLVPTLQPSRGPTTIPSLPPSNHITNITNEGSLRGPLVSAVKQGDSTTGSNNNRLLKPIALTMIALFSCVTIIIASYCFLRKRRKEPVASSYNDRKDSGDTQESNDDILSRVKVRYSDKNATVERDLMRKNVRETSSGHLAIPVVVPAQTTRAMCDDNATASMSESESSFAGVWWDTIYQYISIFPCAPETIED